MNSNLRTDDVIVALTHGIGAELGRKVRSSYFELVTRLSTQADFDKLNLQAQQETVDILALSMFYNEIIAPLESGRSLLALVRKADATHIRIGKSKITPDVSKRMYYCVKLFFEILDHHHIPISLLTFPTLASFVRNVRQAAAASE